MDPITWDGAQISLYTYTCFLEVMWVSEVRSEAVNSGYTLFLGLGIDNAL